MFVLDQLDLLRKAGVTHAAIKDGPRAEMGVLLALCGLLRLLWNAQKDAVGRRP